MVFKNEIFTQESLEGNDHDNSEFLACRFIGDFKFLNFNKCKFTDCDLSQAIFATTSFTECSFPGTKLNNLDFGDIGIFSCNFSKGVMENCIFQKVVGKGNSKRKSMDLRGCLFEETDLNRSVFAFCNLEEVSFSKSNLESVVFELSNLKKTNFSKSNINGATFENCKIDETILDIQGFISFGSSKGFVLNN